MSSPCFVSFSSHTFKSFHLDKGRVRWFIPLCKHTSCILRPCKLFYVLKRVNWLAFSKILIPLKALSFEAHVYLDLTDMDICFCHNPRYTRIPKYKKKPRCNRVHNSSGVFSFLNYCHGWESKQFYLHHRLCQLMWNLVVVLNWTHTTHYFSSAGRKG